MTLNFPPSPVPGEVFTAEGASFVWNGTVWATPGSPFPWARAADGAAGSEIGLVMTPEALDAMLDTFGPAPVAPYPLPLDVTAQRALSVNYQNTTGKPLLVSLLFTRSTGAFTAIVAGFVGATNPATLDLGSHGAYGSGWWATYTIVVPPGWWYRFTGGTGVIIQRWTEYRG